MPINLGVDKKGYFIRWGHQKKYYYNPNSRKSFIIAKSKCEKQMRAIFANGYR